MEEITGKKFDEDKFEQCCQNANRTAKAWLKVCDYLQYKPAPFNGFDLFTIWLTWLPPVAVWKLLKLSNCWPRNWNSM